MGKQNLETQKLKKIIFIEKKIPPLLEISWTLRIQKFQNFELAFLLACVDLFFEQIFIQCQSYTVE